MVFNVRGFTSPQVAPGGVWNEHTVRLAFSLLSEATRARSGKSRPGTREGFESLKGRLPYRAHPRRLALPSPASTGRRSREKADHSKRSVSVRAVWNLADTSWSATAWICCSRRILRWPSVKLRLLTFQDANRNFIAYSDDILMA